MACNYPAHPYGICLQLRAGNCDRNRRSISNSDVRSIGNRDRDNPAFGYAAGTFSYGRQVDRPGC